MQNWKVKLKLNQLQPHIFDNNPASIRGFSYEADVNSDQGCTLIDRLPSCVCKFRSYFLLTN